METRKTNHPSISKKTSLKETLKGLGYVGLIAGAYCAVFSILMYPVISAAAGID